MWQQPKCPTIHEYFTVWHISYNALLSSLKKGYLITFCNMVEFQGHYAKSITRQILHDSTYMRHLKIVKLIETEGRMVVARTSEEEIESCLLVEIFSHVRGKVLEICYAALWVLLTTVHCTLGQEDISLCFYYHKNTREKIKPSI